MFELSNKFTIMQEKIKNKLLFNNVISQINNEIAYLPGNVGYIKCMENFNACLLKL